MREKYTVLNVEELWSQLKFSEKSLNTTYKMRNLNNIIVVWRDLGDLYLSANYRFRAVTYNELTFSEVLKVSQLEHIRRPYSVAYVGWSKDGKYCTPVHDSIKNVIEQSERIRDPIHLWQPIYLTPQTRKLNKSEALTLECEEDGWWITQNSQTSRSKIREVGSWEPS